MVSNNLELKSIENKEDVDTTISFLKSVLTHEIDYKIWEWEFNSFPDDTVLTIIKDKNETVGTQFMLPIKLNISMRDLLSGKCENSYFDNRFRGLGLFQKLFSYAEEISIQKTIEFLWAFTPATKVYEKKLGFTVFLNIIYNFSAQVGKPQISLIKTYTKNNYKIHIKYIYKYLKYLVYKLKYFFFSLKINYSKSIIKYDIRNVLTSFEGIDMLYNTLKLQQNSFVHIKIDEPYLDWRIKNNVNLRYITKYFYKNDDLLGYYILALKEGSANISDFTSLNSETSNVMIIYMLKEISNLKIQHLNYFGNIENELNRNTFNLLKKFGGSIKINEGMPFVFKNISDQNSNNSFLKLSKNWYLNGMWTEGFTY